MRLSEAIRLGSTLNRQGFGNFRVYGGVNGVRTCAIGAALAAIGVTELPNLISSEEEYRAIFYYWPCMVTRQMISCPAAYCIYPKDPLDVIIAHLNDLHRWTREQIADWVASIESAELEGVVEEPQPEVTCPVFAH